MSNLGRVGFGGDNLGGASFCSVPHPVMHRDEKRTVVNQARCELCNEEFMPDSSGSTICSRSLCREVRTYMQRPRRHGEHRKTSVSR